MVEGACGTFPFSLVHNKRYPHCCALSFRLAFSRQLPPQREPRKAHSRDVCGNGVVPCGTSRRRPLRDLIVAALLAIALPCLPLRREGDRDLLAVEGEMLQTPFKRHSPSPACAPAPSQMEPRKSHSRIVCKTALCHAGRRGAVPYGFVRIPKQMHCFHKH